VLPDDCEAIVTKEETHESIVLFDTHCEAISFLNSSQAFIIFRQEPVSPISIPYSHRDYQPARLQVGSQRSVFPLLMKLLLYYFPE